MLGEKQRELIRWITEMGIVETGMVGWCRVWANKVLDGVENWASANGVIIEAEARQIMMSSGLGHTFVWVRINGEAPIILDGTGAEGRSSYFGLETEAPEYLKNSRVDYWLMIDRQS